ncbi:MAG: 3-hydroxyacyl-CoA dehydrogenase family protein [Succiniclasticum sp.]|jgi:3-hydroxybutyryl-CoA dehydrogenase
MKIQNIGIAGAGTMGYSMADIFAARGYEVTLWNHRQPTLDRAKTKISAESRDKIHYTTDMNDIAHCDIVIENVTESMDIKKGFYESFSKIVDDDTILATNTSGLSINALAKFVTHPERFVGMHWFNPPTLILLIEIIKHDKTRQDVAETVRELAVSIGKKPVLVNKDVLGFAANRIQLAVLREALSLVQKGVVSAEDIDAVMKYGLAFRWACIGPLQTTDFGGIDTFYHVSEYLMKDLEDSHEIPPLLKEHYDKGELGVKTGKGFYDYSNGKDVEVTKERDEKLKKLYAALYK